VRCEQRKQECVYQEHKKRGPKPKSKSQNKSCNTSNKRVRSASMNEKMKGRIKRCKVDAEYEDNGIVDDYFEIPNDKILVWIVMKNTSEKVFTYLDPFSTIETVKQYIIEKNTFGISSHTHVSMLALHVFINGEERQLHHSETLSGLLDHVSDIIEGRALVFYVSLLSIKKEVEVPAEVFSFIPPIIQEINNNNGPHWYIDKDMGKCGLEECFSHMDMILVPPIINQNISSSFGGGGHNSNINNNIAIFNFDNNNVDFDFGQTFLGFFSDGSEDFFKKD